MRMTQKSLDKLKEFEGCRLKAYRDAVGVPTIGYGHTGGVRMGTTITMEQALVYLDADITAFESRLAKIPALAELSPNRWDAIVDFSYNLGIGNLAKSTLLRKIKANPDDETIPAEFSRWVYAGGKKLPGLVKRRAWEAKRWRGLV